jgi:hypothetical protein
VFDGTHGEPLPAGVYLAIPPELLRERFRSIAHHHPQPDAQPSLRGDPLEPVDRLER